MQEAAVAAIVATSPSPAVLILKRTSHPKDPWSGHYALPGGRKDPDDQSLFETSIREACEECGIQLSKDFFVKGYPTLRAGKKHDSSMPVTTFLFELPHRPMVKLQQEEIELYQWLPINYAANADNHQNRPMNTVSPETLYPCLPVDQGYVWGFTFRTLMIIFADRYQHMASGIS